MQDRPEMLKIKRYSRSLRIVMNVFYWAAIVAAIGSFIAAVVITLLPDSYFTISDKSAGSLNLSLDGLIQYNLDVASLKEISMKSVYVAITVMAALISLLAMPVLRQIALILKSVEEDKPFAMENAKRISVVGFILILSSLIIPAFEVFAAWTIIEKFNIKNITINYTVNIILILTGFMLFILSGIFRYGSYLQQEYDETV